MEKDYHRRSRLAYPETRSSRSLAPTAHYRVPCSFIALYHRWQHQEQPHWGQSSLCLQVSDGLIKHFPEKLVDPFQCSTPLTWKGHHAWLWSHSLQSHLLKKDEPDLSSPHLWKE
jgi:hypothetical protein